MQETLSLGAQGYMCTQKVIGVWGLEQVSWAEVGTTHKMRSKQTLFPGETHVMTDVTKNKRMGQ